jgi:hypothetical protein
LAVYFIQAGVGGPIKIGHAANPFDRLRALQTAHYEQLTMLGAFSGGRIEELEIHRRLAGSRIRNEWFTPSEDVMCMIATAVDVGTAVTTTVKPAPLKKLIAVYMDDETLRCLGVLVTDLGDCERAHAIRKVIRFIHSTRPWRRARPSVATT